MSDDEYGDFEDNFNDDDGNFDGGFNGGYDGGFEGDFDGGINQPVLQQPTYEPQPVVQPGDEIQYLPEVNAFERVEFVSGINLEELGIDLSTPGSLYYKKTRLGFTDEQIYLIQLYGSYSFLKKRGLKMEQVEFVDLVKRLGYVNKPTLKNTLGMVTGYKSINRKTGKIDNAEYKNIVNKVLPEILEYRLTDVDVLRYARMWMDIPR